MNNVGIDGNGIKMSIKYVHLGNLNMSLILMRSTGVSIRSSDLVQ